MADSSNGRRITVLDATVRTATVEIKTLTVSGKQVTLAVFRQIQDEELIDTDTGEFRGLPWGRVNYHLKECADSGAHHHVIWQQGEELRRDTVYLWETENGERVRRLNNHGNDLLRLLALRLACDEQPNDEKGKPVGENAYYGNDDPYKEFYVKFTGFQLAVKSPEIALIRNRWLKRASWSNEERHDEAIKAAVQILRAEIIRRKPGLGIRGSLEHDGATVIWQAYQKVSDEYNQLKDKMVARLADIEALDHLFIAV